jgi:hypothetical protein
MESEVDSVQLDVKRFKQLLVETEGEMWSMSNTYIKVLNNLKTAHELDTA